MAYKDNREFVKALSRTGDVAVFNTEINWDMEASAITGYSCEKGGPACLFEKIKHYPEGGRILGAPVATYKRLAIALGMSPEAKSAELFEQFEKRTAKSIKPILVKDGPCKEKKMVGAEVDLFRFPAPMVHDGDGGRYIGTWHCVISKDPETGWTNWGMYRLMIFNKNLITGYLRPYSHLGLVLNKYEQAGEPMPVAVALGVDPLCALAAASTFRIGENEADFAGALAREPIELIKCETSDILVPAHAEIVLEGEILPHIRLPEGPFGEFPGFRTQGWAPQPAFRVKAITYRDNPVICLSPEGVGTSDSKIGPSLAGAIAIKVRLKRKGIPVRDVNCPPEMGSLVAVISLKKCDSRILSQIVETIQGRRAAMPKIMLVDEDVDVFNFNEVMHAFATRLHPVKGVSSNPDRIGWTLVPYLSPEERQEGKVACGVYDCTWPSSWTKESEIPIRMSLKNAYPEEARKKAVRLCKKYGF